MSGVWCFFLAVLDDLAVKTVSVVAVPAIVVAIELEQSSSGA
jgi:hypothetical protein